MAWRNSSRTFGALIVLQLVISGCLVLGATLEYDGSGVVAGSLPTGSYGAGLASDGKNLYLFGGSEEGVYGSDRIYRIDPDTLQVQDTGASLPVGRRLAPVVWANDAFYMIGGNHHGDKLDDILAYDPVSNTVTQKAARLPDGLEGTSAVWTGTHVLIFGGCCLLTPPPAPVVPVLWECHCDPSAAVFAYDPVADTVVTREARLPAGRYYTSAVWDGTHAYVIGGENGKLYDEILKYDPESDTFSSQVTRLPRGLGNTAAAWNGTHAYIVGGEDGKSQRPEILVFDPVKESVTHAATTLPSAREHAAAVFHDGALYVVGGMGRDYVDEVLKFEFEKGLKTKYSAAPAAT